MWFLVCKLYRLVYPLVKLNMISKTFRDMEYLKYSEGDA